MSKRFAITAESVAHIKALYDDGESWLTSIDDLVASLEAEWSIGCHDVLRSSMSLVTFADRDEQPYAVLKLMPPKSEYFRKELETHTYFEGALARVIKSDAARGALLIERMMPGDNLSSLSARDDAAAIGVIADCLRSLWRSVPDADVVTVASLLDDFDSSDASELLPPGLIDSARAVFTELVSTEGERMLLHGDLHHANVLRNGNGWMPIDPQGIVGEREYDTAAAMRNPFGVIESETDLIALTERRASQFAERLGLDAERIVKWAYAQTALSVCWQLSDGRELVPAWVKLATALSKRFE